MCPLRTPATLDGSARSHRPGVPMRRTKSITVGLVLAALLGVLDTLSLASVSSGPAPVAVNVVDGVLGVLTLVGVVTAWRRSAAGVALVIVTRVLSGLTSLPAFVADVPAWLRVLAAVQIALTAIVVYLIAPARRGLRTARSLP